MICDTITDERDVYRSYILIEVWVMANFKKMYYTLLGETSRAIELLQEAQKKTEQIFIESSDDSILTLVPNNEEGDEP